LELVQTIIGAAGIIFICGVVGAAPVYLVMLRIWPARAATPAARTPQELATPQITRWSELVYRPMPVGDASMQSPATASQRLTVVRPAPADSRLTNAGDPEGGRRKLRLLTPPRIEAAE
jgi:hypothetical protein